MAQQGAGFDMSKLSTSDKITAGGAIALLIWTFFPFWYKLGGDVGEVLEAFGGDSGINGWRGVTFLAALLAIVAIIEVVLKVVGTNMSMPLKRGLLHLALAGVGALLTILGLIASPSGFSASWGAFVGIVFALVWVYGAYMMYQEPSSEGGAA